MTIPEDVLSIAKQFIGYKETGVNQTYFGSWYGAHDQWCAMFVSYCLFVAGIPESADCRKGFCYNPTGVKWFKAKGRYFEEPMVGDVAFIDRHKGCHPCQPWENGDCSDAWHVGLVEEIIDANTIVTIEGNESDQVKRMHRTRQNDWYGFGRPNYNGIPNPKTDPDVSRWPGRYIRLTSPYMSGDDVRAWKTRMVERGWKFSGDLSVFDKETHDILIDFQSQKYLEQDGVIGPISWRAAWELPILI